MKTIIVTGAAQGIGSAITTKLCDYGFHVIGIDRDEEAVEEMQHQTTGKNASFKVFDLARSEAISSLCEGIKKDYGKVYGLVNNAARACNKNIEEVRLEEWETVLKVNLTAPWLLVKHLSSLLKQSKGVIVNICSTRALMSEADTEAYSASKGGLLTLTHSLAMSLGPNVRVNAISPGWIETRDLQKKDKRQDIFHRDKDKLQHPVGRVGEVNDVVEMVNYLLSDKAGFITGQNFVVDGGMTRKMIYEE